MAQQVVIIGAGITGTLTGLELAKAGWKVRIVEAHHVGFGSSARTAAGIRQQWTTPGTVVGMRYSVDYYARWAETVGGPSNPIAQVGYLFLIPKGQEQDAQERVQMQRNSGLSEVQYLTPEQTAEQFPYVEPDAIGAATFCPTDGFLRPEVVYNEAAEAGRRHGVELRLNSPVSEAKHAGDRLTAVKAGGDWLEADLFIDCTNAWSPRLAPILGASIAPVNPLKRYLWFYERGGPMKPETLKQMPMVITPSGAYCRPENADSLMAGWAHDAPPEPRFTDEDQDTIEAAYSHKSGVDSRAYDTWFALAEALPPVGEFAGVTATTSGFYGTTPDHNPYLGFGPDVPNLMRLVGFSGHGAMFGPFTAQVAVALASAGTNLAVVSLPQGDVDLSVFALDRTFRATETMVI